MFKKSSKETEPQNENELGLRILKADKDLVEVERKTRETVIKCRVEAGKRRNWNIDTGIQFFNHMIEMLAYYSEFNIDLEVRCQRFKLSHTIIEDSGIVLGRAFHVMAMERIKAYGIRGFGFSQCALDEAYSEARIFFEGRTGCWITRDDRVKWFGTVEDVQEEFMLSFFEGFSQGMRATIHLDLKRASDPHHLWESAFRAFGDALKYSLTKDEWRKGWIAGVKGVVD